MTPAELSRLRQGVYRFVGAGFDYPSSEMLSAAGGVMPVLEELGIYDLSFAIELAEAASAFASADFDQLSVAYVSLFEAGAAGAACPPHESAYVADARTGQVAGLHSDLRRTVLRYGLRLDANSTDMVDHVATEMHLMSMLAQREAELRLEGRAVERVTSHQLEFLTTHLMTWVPRFASLIRQKDRHEAYTALAGATRAFLAHEQQLLPLLVADARTPA